MLKMTHVDREKKMISVTITRRGAISVPPVPLQRSALGLWLPKTSHFPRDVTYFLSITN